MRKLKSRLLTLGLVGILALSSSLAGCFHCSEYAKNVKRKTPFHRPGAGNLAQMQLISGKDAVNHLMNKFLLWTF
ncbi:hypothetical protein [Parablautia intestinalis]|uniref:hypothetical protein n=1 Tax=Parablautia intestinalis TaxID=2320100 RepID=UPI0011C3660B|nr:hypothetical protein [Parablautia intestinalis]